MQFVQIRQMRRATKQKPPMEYPVNVITVSLEDDLIDRIYSVIFKEFISQLILSIV